MGEGEREPFSEAILQRQCLSKRKPSNSTRKPVELASRGPFTIDASHESESN